MSLALAKTVSVGTTCPICGNSILQYYNALTQATGTEPIDDWLYTWRCPSSRCRAKFTALELIQLVNEEVELQAELTGEEIVEGVEVDYDKDNWTI